MRLLLAFALTLTAGASTAAEPERRSITVHRNGEVSLQPDCSRPVIEHARGERASGPSRLADQPAAFRLHAVNRTVGGCPVYPEAQKVSDTRRKSAASKPHP